MKALRFLTVALATWTVAAMVYTTTAQANYKEFPVQFDIETALESRPTVLLALGTAVYYSQNCMGLTHRGQRLLNQAVRKHSIVLSEVEDNKEFKTGYKLAASYKSCGKLRFAISDAGLGAMIR
jgi:hypothetical protein